MTALVGDREKRREDVDIFGWHTIRFLVRGENGTIGSYGVHYRPDGTAYGASRDYHRPAQPGDAEAYERWTAWLNDDDSKDADEPPIAMGPISHCGYCGCEALCDGSSLVEIVENDAEAWAIAEMMAR